MANRQRQREDVAVLDSDLEAEADPQEAQEEEEVVPKIAEQTQALSNNIVSPADLKGGKVRLTSGLVVEIKRAKLLSLAQSGKIPNPLISAAIRATEKGIGDLQEDELEGLDEKERKEAEVENALNMEHVVNALVCAVLVQPKAVMTPEEETDDSIWVGSLDYTDRYDIYRWAQERTALWATF